MAGRAAAARRAGGPLMPLARAASGVRCVKHGTDCAISNGSNYRSAYCARVPKPSRWDPPAAPDVERDPELDGLLIERRATDAGVSLDEAANALAVEWAAGRAAWARLTPVQRCQARDGEDAELAELIAASRAKAAAT